MKSRYVVFLLVLLFSLQAQAQMMEPPGDMGGHMSIHFISQPPLTGQVGVPYLYTAKAVSSDSTDVIRYSARLSTMFPTFVPVQELSIDSVTGVVTWTPQVRGWYTVEITARDTHGTMAMQRFAVGVSGSTGTIAGRVTDTLGNGIPGVIIKVLQFSSVDTNQDMQSGEMEVHFMYMAVTNLSGYYRITGVDPGSYKLRAVSPTRQYESQWYNGKTSAATADSISVVDTPAVSLANIVLRGGVLIQPRVTVSGSVMDSTSAAIHPAQVFFVRAGFALNTNNTVDDFREMFDRTNSRKDERMEGNSDCAFHAPVDSVGQYSIKIPKGTYIIFVKAPGFITEYFNHATDILSATQISIQNDTSGINFTLAHVPPVMLGSISGSVTDSSKNIGISSRIIAIRDHWTSRDDFSVGRSYVTDTDTLGNYTLSKLLPGSYFVLAVPLGNYAPAFYSNTNDTLSMRWHHATKVVVHGDSVSGIAIYVHQIPASFSGFAGISGTIQDQADASLVPGTLVFAMQNGVVAGFGIADAMGTYSIDGLAPGRYSVIVDKVGYTEAASQTASISYSTSGTPVSATINFALTETPTDVAEPVSSVQPMSFELKQNYPNPFNPSTMIQYTLASPGVVSLKVYNIIGQEVTTLASGYQNAGAYKVEFNGQGLASGIYLYRLHTPNADVTKKMVLLQ